MGLPNIDTQFFSFLETVETKLKTHSFVNAKNVYIGESPDLAGLTDDDFPRLEILPLVDNGTGYESQRHITHSYQFGIAGYIRRSSSEVKKQDVKNIIAMGESTRSLIFGLLDDKQQGLIEFNKFDYIDGQPMLDFDFELFDDISTFLFGFMSNAQTKDTQI